jgi:hypothetical protein
MCQTFERRGRSRQAHRTPNDHLLDLLLADRLAMEAREDLETIVRAFEREAFSGQDVDEHLGQAASEAADRLRALARAAPG